MWVGRAGGTGGSSEAGLLLVMGVATIGLRRITAVSHPSATLTRACHLGARVPGQLWSCPRCTSSHTVIAHPRLLCLRSPVQRDHVVCGPGQRIRLRGVTRGSTGRHCQAAVERVLAINVELCLIALTVLLLVLHCVPFLPSAPITHPHVMCCTFPVTPAPAPGSLRFESRAA